MAGSTGAGTGWTGVTTRGLGATVLFFVVLGGGLVVVRVRVVLVRGTSTMAFVEAGAGITGGTVVLGAGAIPAAGPTGSAGPERALAATTEMNSAPSAAVAARPRNRRARVPLPSTNTAFEARACDDAGITAVVADAAMSSGEERRGLSVAAVDLVSPDRATMSVTPPGPTRRSPRGS